MMWRCWILVCMTMVGEALPVHNLMEPLLLHDHLYCASEEQDRVCRYGGSTSFDGSQHDSLFHLILGANTDYVVDRKMKLCSNEGEVARWGFYSIAGKMGCTIGEICELFVTAGSMKIHKTEVRQILWPPIQESEVLLPLSHIYSNAGLAWSGGGVFSYCMKDCIVIGISGEYKQGYPELNRILSDSISLYWDENKKMRYREIQGAGGVALWIPMTEDRRSGLSLYAAVKYAHALFDFKNTLSQVNGIIPHLDHFRMQEQKRVGFAHGISWVAGDFCSCTVEGRWVDEKGIFVYAQFCL